MSTKRSVLRAEETSELVSVLRVESLQRSNLLIEERAKMTWIMRVFSDQLVLVKEREISFAAHDQQQRNKATAAAARGTPGDGDDEYLDPREAAKIIISVAEDNEFFQQFKEAKEREQLELRQRDWSRYEEEARQLRREALEKHNSDALLGLHCLRAPRKNFTRSDVPSFLLRQKFHRDETSQVGEDVPNDQRGLLPSEVPPPLTYPPVQLRRNKDKKGRSGGPSSQRLSALLVPLGPALDAIADATEREDEPDETGEADGDVSNASSAPAPAAAAATSKAVSLREKVESPRRHMSEMDEDLSTAVEPSLEEEEDASEDDEHVDAPNPDDDIATSTAPAPVVSPAPAPEESGPDPVSYPPEALQADLPQAAPVSTETPGSPVQRSPSPSVHAPSQPSSKHATPSRRGPSNPKNFEAMLRELQTLQQRVSDLAVALQASQQQQDVAQPDAALGNIPEKEEVSGEAGEPAAPSDSPQTHAPQSDDQPAKEKEASVDPVTASPNAPEEEEEEEEEAKEDVISEQVDATAQPTPSAEVDSTADGYNEAAAAESHEAPQPVVGSPESERTPPRQDDAPVGGQQEEEAEAQADEAAEEESAADQQHDGPEALLAADADTVSHEEAYFRARILVTEIDYLRDLFQAEEHRRQQAQRTEQPDMRDIACETTPRLRGPADPEQESIITEEEFLREAQFALERQAAEALVQKMQLILEEHANAEEASNARAAKTMLQIFLEEQDAMSQDENTHRLDIIGEFNREMVEGVTAVFNNSMITMVCVDHEFTDRLELTMKETTYRSFIRRFVRYIHTSDVIGMSSDQVRENIFHFATSDLVQQLAQASAVEPLHMLDAREHAERRSILIQRLKDEPMLSIFAHWLVDASPLEAAFEHECMGAFTFAAQTLVPDNETVRRRALRQQRLELFDRHADEQEAITQTCVGEKRELTAACHDFRQLMFGGLPLICDGQSNVDLFVTRASRDYQVFAEFAALQMTNNHEKRVRIAGREIDNRSGIESEEVFERSIFASFLHLYTFKLFLVQDVFVDSCQRAFNESTECIVETIQRLALRNSLRNALADQPSTAAEVEGHRDARLPEQEQGRKAQEEVEETPRAQEAVSSSPDSSRPQSNAVQVRKRVKAATPPPETIMDPFPLQVMENKESNGRLRIQKIANESFAVIMRAHTIVFTHHIDCVDQFLQWGSMMLSRVFTGSIQLAMYLHKLSKKEIETRSLVEYDCLLFCAEFLRVVTYVGELSLFCDIHCGETVAAYDAAVSAEGMVSANSTAVGREIAARRSLADLEERQWEDFTRLHHVLFSRCVLYRVVQGNMKACFHDITAYMVDSILLHTELEETEQRAFVEWCALRMQRDMRHTALFLCAGEIACQKWQEAKTTAFADFAETLYRSYFAGGALRFEIENRADTTRFEIEAEEARFLRPILLYGVILNAVQRLNMESLDGLAKAHRIAFAGVLDAASMRVRLSAEHARQREDLAEVETEARAVLDAEEATYFISGPQRYRRYVEAVVTFEKKCVSLKISFCEQFEAKAEKQLRRTGTVDMSQVVEGDLRRKNTMATLASVPSMHFSTGTQRNRTYSVVGADAAANMAISELDSMPPALRDNGMAICDGDPEVTSLSLKNIGDALTDRVLENLVSILEARGQPFGQLDLSGNAGTLPALLPTVVKLFRLVTELDLSSCGLQAEHENLLSSALSDPSDSLVTLRALLLNDNDLSAAFTGSAGRVIRNTNFLLLKLNLSGNKQIPQNQQRLMQFLCDLNRFDRTFKSKILALEAKQKNADTDFAAETRTNADGVSEFVRTLDDIAARCVCVTMSAVALYSKVSLRGQNLTDRSATLFSHLLRSNANLTHVDLSHNFLTDKGLKELASAMQTNTTIVELQLDGNAFSDEATLTMVADKCRRNAREVQDTSTFSARERNGT